MDNDRQASKPTAVIVALIALAMMTVPTASAGGGIMLPQIPQLPPIPQVLPPLPPLPPVPSIFAEERPCDPDEYGKCMHLIVTLETAKDIEGNNIVRGVAKLYAYSNAGDAHGKAEVRYGNHPTFEAECFESTAIVGEVLQLLMLSQRGCWAIAQTDWHDASQAHCAWGEGLSAHYIEPGTGLQVWQVQYGSDCP